MKPVEQHRRRNSRKWPLLLMALPGIVYFLINNYIPMLGMFIAFKDVNYAKGIFASDWVGFKNFEFLFRTKDAFIITRNTLLYNIVFVILNLIVGIALAIMINEVLSKVKKKVYQTFVLVPYLISMVIVGYLVYALLSGETGFINNRILRPLGLKEINWYSEPKYWPFILCLVNTWKNGGYYCIIYLASIVSIDTSYYEAATLDGATDWQKILHITLPTILPVIITMTFLQIGKIFNSDFGLFYQVTMDSGMILDATNVIDTYVYRGLMKLGDIGMSAAAGMYQSVVGCFIVVLTNAIVKRFSRENAMF